MAGSDENGFEAARNMCRKELAERKALSEELGRKKAALVLSELLDQGESWADDD